MTRPPSSSGAVGLDEFNVGAKGEIVKELLRRGDPMLPDQLVRFCGADCSGCDAYQGFLAGDDGGVVNPETGYRCCWLPASYPRGRDCPIRTCCEERGLTFCGECTQFAECIRMAEFYAQPGYDRLRKRMLAEVARMAGRVAL